MKCFAGTDFYPADIFPEQQGPQVGRGFFGIMIARLACVLATLTQLVLPAAADTPQVLLDGGQGDQAMPGLEQHIQSAPTAEAYNLLCRADFELDDWDAGIPACEKAVSLAPDNGLYHLWLGRIYGEKADHSNFLKAAGLAKKVRVEFERAVEFAPTSWEARTDLAEFYLEAPAIVGGGEDKARDQANLLLPLNPGMAHWVRARIAQKNKDSAAAEQEYRAAIDASQGAASAWLNLAGFYRRASRFEEMEQALTTMETRPLDDPAALMDGANMLFRTGRSYSMAIRFARGSLASDPVEGWAAFKAHNLLGELLEKQGAPQAAAVEYRTSLSMARSFTSAQKGLDRVAANE